MAKISAINFCTFIQHAKLDNIEKFLELTSTTQDGQNLAFFWEQAYNQGYTEGRENVLNEELEYEWMQHSQAVGYKEGYNKGKADSDTLQDLNIEAARTAAFEEGHHVGVETNCHLTSKVGVQSEMLYMPPTPSSSTQTSLLSLINDNMQTPITTELPLQASSLNWAEDATSLPILPPPPTPVISHQHAP
jgi:hypothetical protein